MDWLLERSEMVDSPSNPTVEKEPGKALRLRQTLEQTKRSGRSTDPAGPPATAARLTRAGNRRMVPEPPNP